MKKQFINGINPGDAINDIFVLSEKSLSKKRDGNPFLNVVLSDRTGSTKGVVWDNVNQIAEGAASGDFVHVMANAGEYKGSIQLVIKQMTSLPADSIDPADFLPTTTRNVDHMFIRLKQITASMENENFKKLIESFWNDAEFARTFKTAPAAKKMHHAFIGGLLEHTLSMALLVDRIAGHYSGINRDLLLAGAMLHDIGKTRAFEYRTKIDYSDEGRLLNHIVIGLQMIDERLRGLEGFSDEQAVMLKHLVVSHHGSKAFGSPEPPKTIEAILLYYIDEIDSKVNGIRDFIASEDPNAAWTSFHRVLDRHFYTGGKEKKEKCLSLSRG